MMRVLRCARCGVQACRQDPAQAAWPECCPMHETPPAWQEAVQASTEMYEDPQVRAFAAASARTEAAGYCRDTRVEEVMAFARRLGVDQLGVAFCVSLVREAGMLQDILERQGFRVSSVCCKAGSLPKEHIGLTDAEKVHPGRYEPLCNPIGQAKLLDAAGTGLNVVVGLCVGHDSLFFAHSRAPVTVLVAKDRVLGHDPAAALYLLSRCDRSHPLVRAAVPGR